MVTFYKFGKLWEIPPAAARLGKSLPANTRAFETFLTNLEPMYSAFITAHPRCPKDPDLPAVRYAIREFMEEQAPSNFFKERWAASYDPARKVTYVSWFLGTIAYFLDKLDFTSLVPPPSKQSFRSSLPSCPARLLILLHLHATRRPPLHRQTQHPGIPANSSLPPHPPPRRAAGPGSGMRGPQAWRRWRRGTPRNAKPNSGMPSGKRPRSDQLGPGTPPRT